MRAYLNYPYATRVYHMHAEGGRCEPTSHFFTFHRFVATSGSIAFLFFFVGCYGGEYVYHLFRLF